MRRCWWLHPSPRFARKCHSALEGLAVSIRSFSHSMPRSRAKIAGVYPVSVACAIRASFEQRIDASVNPFPAATIKAVKPTFLRDTGIAGCCDQFRERRLASRRPAHCRVQRQIRRSNAHAAIRRASRAEDRAANSPGWRRGRNAGQMQRRPTIRRRATESSSGGAVQRTSGPSRWKSPDEQLRPADARPPRSGSASMNSTSPLKEAIRDKASRPAGPCLERRRCRQRCQPSAREFNDHPARTASITDAQQDARVERWPAMRDSTTRVQHIFGTTMARRPSAQAMAISRQWMGRKWYFKTKGA